MELLDAQEKKLFLSSLKQLGVKVTPLFPNKVHTKEGSINVSIALKKIVFIYKAVKKKPVDITKYNSVDHGLFAKHYRRVKMLNDLFIALDKAKIPHEDGIIHCFATFLWKRHYNDPNPRKKPYNVISGQIQSVLNGIITCERDEKICLDMIEICELIAPFADNFFQDITVKSTDYSAILAAIKESTWEEIKEHTNTVIGVA